MMREMVRVAIIFLVALSVSAVALGAPHSWFVEPDHRAEL